MSKEIIPSLDSNRNKTNISAELIHSEQELNKALI